MYGATSASGGTSDYTGTYSGSYTFSYTDYQASWNISYTWTEPTTYSQCSLASQQCTTATTATVNGTNAISVPSAGIPQTYGIEVIVNPADESCRLTSTGKTYRGISLRRMTTARPYPRFNGTRRPIPRPIRCSALRSLVAARCAKPNRIRRRGPTGPWRRRHHRGLPKRHLDHGIRI